MVKLQKAGGLAALAEALAYLIGFIVMATLLNPSHSEGWSRAQKLAFVLERKTFFQAWTIVIGVFGSAFLVVLAVGLHDRLKAKSSELMQVATPFALIWAGLVMASGMIEILGLEAVAKLQAQDMVQATSAWVIFGTIQNGLGGGIEFVGGLWVLLISFASLRAEAFPRLLSCFGFAVGLVGILTVAPPLGRLVEVFGLTQIVWFVWIGMALLRQPAPTPQDPTGRPGL